MIIRKKYIYLRGIFFNNYDDYANRTRFEIKMFFSSSLFRILTESDQREKEEEKREMKTKIE